MEGILPRFTVRRTFFIFLNLILLHSSTQQTFCVDPPQVDFYENNKVDDVVVTVTDQPGVTIAFRPPVEPNNPFKINGPQVLAARVFDFEVEPDPVLVVVLNCFEPGSTTNPASIRVVVVLKNLNDNPPVFEKTLYHINVSEMSPENTEVGRIVARDLDGDTLYYRLGDESNAFKLLSPTSPTILVQTPLEYDEVKNVSLTLFVQDTPLAGDSSTPSFNDSINIVVTVLDVDNRPPWFQPCDKFEIGANVICLNSGYTSSVTLNERKPGALSLNPEPLQAIDGDSGINEEITYKILSGNVGNLFEINADTGSITMQKPADVLGPITLTVLATQKMNSVQFSTTTVTINVLVKSLNPPEFQRSEYIGTVTGVGNMAVDPKNEPLQILATDDDYAAVGGINPNINYFINGNSDFAIIGGYIFMTKDLPEATLNLQVVARDTSNDERATAQLLLEVKSGVTTTVPPSTTDRTATPPPGESTTNSGTTVNVSPTSPSMSTDSSISTVLTTTSRTTVDGGSTTKISTSTDSSVSTTGPSITSDSTSPTTKPDVTSDESVSTASTTQARTVITPPGGYSPKDMAALGATLGVVLFISLVVIALLIFRARREKGDWEKIYETNKFRTSLGKGSGVQKEGIQYTNDAFQKDEDGDSDGSGSADRGNVVLDKETLGAVKDFAQYETTEESSVPVHDDNISQSEKEVKPILTKARRVDEGYKSVWFKDDIEPDAKEEVVIIPDSREHDSEEEDEQQIPSDKEEEEEEEEDENPEIKTARLVFNDADVNNGRRVKIEDPSEDKQNNEWLNIDL